ncbi:MAG: hypothetical protein H0Z29_06310 [Candidatus Marinimicrobia bacterium]|nr:hypothetical protein [Candidatus Neomarinimicrobiota bacterium]
MTTKNNKNIYWLLFPIFIGVISIITQNVFIRVGLSTFQGNEIALCIIIGHWLLLTGLGSRLRLYFKRSLKSEKLFIKISMIFIFSTAASILFYMFSKRLIGLPQQEILGIIPIFVISFSGLLLPCLANGMFFPLLVGVYEEDQIDFPINRVYSMETLGSAIGSLLLWIFLISGMNSIMIIFFTLLFFSIILYLVSCGERITFLFLLIIISLLLVASNKINSLIWKPQRLVEYKESEYSSIAITDYYNMKTLYTSSSPAWIFNNSQSREEIVHFPLLLCDRPENILVIGVGNYEMAFEIAKHPTIKYILILQKDKILQDRLNEYSFMYRDSIRRDVKIQFSSLRVDDILKNDSYRFDVVILNLPLPSSAYLNSFYTSWFFDKIKDIITQDGILALHFPGGENYLSEENIEFLKIIENTVKKSFKKLVWIPGSTIHLLASDSIVNISYDKIIEEIKNRKLNLRYIREYYLFDRLNPLRFDFLNSNLMRCDVRITNSLHKPIGYYFTTILWDKRTGGILKDFYKFLNNIDEKIIYTPLIFLLLPILFRKRREALLKEFIFSIGFISMSMIGLYIIIYQSMIGDIYIKILFLNLSFMVGASIGSWFAKIYNSFFNRIYRWFFLLLLMLILAGYIFVGVELPDLIYTVVIPALILITGISCGILFPVLTLKIRSISGSDVSSSSAVGYSLDIFGACAGLYLISVIILPVYGLYVSLNILSVYTIILSILCFFCK